MTSKAYENALTKFDATANEYRRQEVLSIVSKLIRHDAAVFTRAELLRFARREQLTVTELTAAVEYCWLCGWCGYDPQSGMVGGGAMEAFRTEGARAGRTYRGEVGEMSGESWVVLFVVTVFTYVAIGVLRDKV